MLQNWEEKEFVDLFLKHDFDPNYKDNQGWTPLNIAIDFSQNSVAKRLIHCEKTSKDIDVSSFTPIMLATFKENEEIVSELIKAEANLYKINNQGKTALDLAKEKNHQSIIEKISEAIKIPNNSVTEAKTERLYTIDNEFEF